jgi:Glycosyltransferase family 87
MLGCVALGLYDGVYVIKWWLGTPQPPFGDFFGFWSFGRFAAISGSAIYDPFALTTYQHTLDPSLSGYPYPYPPTFALLLIPFGWMNLPLAYFCWIAATFALYAVATLGRQWRSMSGLALLTAPTTLLTVISGQNGLLSAALLIAGLRSFPRAPGLGGVFLGLLTYKPQLALMVPIVLLASRSIRATVAAAMTVLVIVALSSAALGWSMWPRWIEGFSAYQQLLQANQANLSHLMPTMAAGLQEIGAPAAAGHAVQLLCAGVVAVLTSRACAQGIDERAIATVVVGSIVAAPYVMIYDMPMITAALVIYWTAHPPARLWEVALVIALFASLVGMVTSVVPFAAATLLFALFLILATSRAAGDPSVKLCPEATR